MSKLSLAPSSNVEGAEYDEKTRTLIVTFHGGRSYAHQGVDAETAQLFESAPSAGKFYAEQIKGRFPHSRA